MLACMLPVSAGFLGQARMMMMMMMMQASCAWLRFEFELHRPEDAFEFELRRPAYAFEFELRRPADALR